MKEKEKKVKRDMEKAVGLLWGDRIGHRNTVFSGRTRLNKPKRRSNRERRDNALLKRPLKIPKE